MSTWSTPTTAPLTLNNLGLAAYKENNPFGVWNAKAPTNGITELAPTAPDSSGLTSEGMLGLAGLGLKGLGAFTDWQQLGLAKDTLAFNKMNANRNYEAEKTKYNNAYDRTDAVNKVYGSQTVGTKI